MNASGKTFSVLSVSKRNGWEGIAFYSIYRQTVTPEDWIVVREHNIPVNVFASLYTPVDFKIRINPVSAPHPTRVSNLNASLNAGLKLIKTDYVIFYQDFIKLQPDCFKKLLDLVDDSTFVTTCTPNYDGSDDSRYTGNNDVHECPPRHWEANVAIAPMKVILELGGFDEEYDNGWSWDNVNLAERAEILGCKFIIDESNRPKLYPHEMSSHETLPSNADRHYETMRATRHGDKPLRLSHL